MRTPEWFGGTEESVAAKGTVAISRTHPPETIDEVVAAFDALIHRLADHHAPEFLEIDVTMPQAKLLYLLGAGGDLHMSELVARLGVSLSTVSGLVDRVVDHGLASRREDAADRRQVVVGLTREGAAFIDRFRELNARQMREMLGLLDEAELRHVRGALAALDRAAARLASVHPAPSRRTTGPSREDPA